MAEIIVDVVATPANNKMEFRWRFPGGYEFRQYNVNLQLLQEHSRYVREALQKLVDAGRDHSENVRAALQQLVKDGGKLSQGARAALQARVDAGRDKRTADYAALVSEVAKEGYGLYDTLFFGLDPPDKVMAKRVRAWVSDKVHPFEDTITFRISGLVHIPWSLLYDQQIGGVDPSAGSNFDALPHFWSSKYGLVTSYEAIPPFEEQWPVEQFGLLFGAHQEVWKAVVDLLPADEGTALRALMSPDQPKFSFQELASLWEGQKDKAPHGLLSFLCHASGTNLLMGNETISASMFTQRFERNEAVLQPPTVVFLGGCQTAIGDLEGGPKEGFLSATAKEGYCGFIGTEAKVPDLFMLRFFVRFLNLFYAGEGTIGEIMQKLRRDHWPLSLVIAVCCPRELKLSPKPSGSSFKPLDSKPNLSFEPVSH